MIMENEIEDDEETCNVDGCVSGHGVKEWKNLCSSKMQKEIWLMAPIYFEKKLARIITHVTMEPYLSGKQF